MTINDANTIAHLISEAETHLSDGVYDRAENCMKLAILVIKDVSRRKREEEIEAKLLVVATDRVGGE